MVGPYIYRPTAVQLGPPAIVHQLLTETATYHSSDKTVRASAASLCLSLCAISYVQLTRALQGLVRPLHSAGGP